MHYWFKGTLIGIAHVQYHMIYVCFRTPYRMSNSATSRVPTRSTSQHLASNATNSIGIDSKKTCNKQISRTSVYVFHPKLAIMRKAQNDNPLWAKQSWAFSLDSQFEYELFSSIWGWKPYSVNFCMNNTVHIYEASKFIMHFMTCMFDMAWMPLASVWWDTWINTYYCVFLT